MTSTYSNPGWGSVGSLTFQADCNRQPVEYTDAKQGRQGLETGHDKGVQTHITVSWGDGHKTQQPLQPGYCHSTLPDYHTWLQIGCAQSMYPYADQGYTLLSAYAPQTEGRMMLPWSLTEDEGPVFVNAKQYHGILRRRESRARADLMSKPLRARKPYQHESRHLHAKRRARGAGGRFLNTKTLNCLREDCSQNSEDLQSDSANPNSKETDIATSASEASSLFQIGIPQLSPFYLQNPVGIGHDSVTVPFNLQV